MYPEAGGSSSFARHAFNELVSFFAAWGQMLNYIITVAISAFFVPALPGGLLGAARPGPGDIIGGDRPDRAAGGAQRQGHRGVGAAQPRARDRRPRDPGRAGRDRARARPQTPTLLVDNVDLGVAPDLGRLRARDRGRDDRLHRDRDDLEHGRGGPRRDRGRSRAGVGLDGARGGRPLRAAAGRSRSRRCRSPRTPAATTRPSSARPSPTTRCSGSSRTSASAPGLTDVLRVYVGILAAVILLIATNAGADRRLAAHLLDGPAPPAARAAAPGPPDASAPPTSRSSSSRRSRRSRCCPGETDLPGDDVLVRRDALVHDRPRLGDRCACCAAASARTRSGPGSRPLNVRHSRGRGAADARCSAGSGPSRAWIVVMALDPMTLAVGGGWMVVGMAALRRSTAAPGPAADARRSRS